jgi:hypothetical protein
MATIHADSKSRPFALAIATQLTAAPRNFGLKSLKLAVSAPTGAPDELVLAIAGAISDTKKPGSLRHKLAISFTVTLNGKTQRFKVDNNLAMRGTPTDRDRWESLAGVGAHKLAPYFAAKPRAKAGAKTIHVEAFHARNEPRFRARIIAGLHAQGFRTKVTLGLSDIDPDPSCWGFLSLPFVNAQAWRNGKVALSPTPARAGRHEAKTTIRATVEPELSEARAAAVLADKLVAWYGKLAAIAQDRAE